MKTPRTRIASVIADQTLSQGITKQLSSEVAAYLLAERRASELDSILRDVQADWADAGYVEVIATSAHALSEAVKADITEQVAARVCPDAKQIIITEVHDPAAIGGVRLTLANQQLDLSVQAKLNKFKQLTAVGKD